MMQYLRLTSMLETPSTHRSNVIQMHDIGELDSFNDVLNALMEGLEKYAIAHPLDKEDEMKFYMDILHPLFTAHCSLVNLINKAIGE